MCLILATTPFDAIFDTVIVILKVALGLGAVIFVHELGHFAVAKMCGVKCDKFFIGFDVGGYKISKKWGETEYGIGILPLGGYVKMLGQDDNPANIVEQVRESEVSGGASIATKEITGPDGEKYVVDQRSYLAKSVPQRMAIISAGVIMNIIFAFIFAVIAYGMGVPVQPTVVSQVAPGSAAYQAGLRPGDEVIQIDDIKNPTFSQLMQNVMLGDMEKGVLFHVRRAESGEVEEINLRPRQNSGRLARIGIAVGPTLELLDKKTSLQLPSKRPVSEGTAADTAGFEPGDEILEVNGQPVKKHHELLVFLMQNIDQSIEVKVRRGGETPKDDPYGELSGGEMVTLTVPAQKQARLGLVMEIGKIVAVEKGSPADKQGLQAGDFIDKISYSDEPTADQALGGIEFDDPIALPQLLNKLADENRSIRLSVRRANASDESQQANEELDFLLRKVTWEEPAISKDDPISVPSLGLAYRVLNRVRNVLPESPAAKAGLQNDDVITQAEFIYKDKKRKAGKPLKFGSEGEHNWPVFMEFLQGLPEGTQVKLTYKRGKDTKTATLAPKLSDNQFIVDRGMIFASMKRMKRADSFGQQVEFGYEETKSSLGLVYRFLSKIGGQVPASMMGGPITIVKAAGGAAEAGMGRLLLFLTMLSANLAVINFMPIPMLDGGHMVFLLYEGVRGRPASERVVVALHTIGFVCIITLMLFVFGLDLGFIPRNM